MSFSSTITIVARKNRYSERKRYRSIKQGTLTSVPLGDASMANKRPQNVHVFRCTLAVVKPTLPLSTAQKLR